MQTFLPYPDFEASARCLDTRRLGKQRVEAAQILKTLRGKSSGWKNHPAVLMWKGHEEALENYLRAMIVEWMLRGFRNTMRIPILHPNPAQPRWMGDAAFHSAHRSNLLRKHFDHYMRFGWSEPSNLPYVWPVKK